MDAVVDDRGQSALLAAVVIAIAAVAMSGLRLAQHDLLVRGQQSRAGEAAVEAAAAVVADAYLAAIAAPPEEGDDFASFVRSDTVRAAAASAASALSAANGGPPVIGVDIACAAGKVEVTIVSAGRTHRAGFTAPECSPH
jgi:hypothetical protein